MPQKIEYQKEDFIFLKSQLERIGFRQLSQSHRRDGSRRLGLVAPRKLSGSEVGFYYSHPTNSLTAIVWTTYIEAEEKFREQDMAWCLIKKNDHVLYYSKPVRRTKNFLINLLSKAWIVKYRVDFHPLCHKCDASMRIQQKANGGYFYACFKRDDHDNKKPVFTPWDSIGPKGVLPKKAQAFVDKMRARLQAYRNRNSKAGIVRKPMSQIRKKWIMKRPQNMIS
jgi:hypothetical protein